MNLTIEEFKTQHSDEEYFKEFRKLLDEAKLKKKKKLKSRELV